MDKKVPPIRLFFRNSNPHNVVSNLNLEETSIASGVKMPRKMTVPELDLLKTGRSSNIDLFGFATKRDSIAKNELTKNSPKKFFNKSNSSGKNFERLSTGILTSTAMTEQYRIQTCKNSTRSQKLFADLSRRSDLNKRH